MAKQSINGKLKETDKHGQTVQRTEANDKQENRQTEQGQIVQRTEANDS